MKFTKVTFFIFFLFLNWDLFSQVNVSYINKTGKMLDSLVVNGAFIGKLDADSVSKKVKYKFLTYDSGSPQFSASAVMDGESVATPNYSQFCGSERGTGNEGNHRIEIRSADTPQGKILLLYDLSCGY